MPVVYQRRFNAFGSYWSSPNSYAEIRSDVIKCATMGSNPEGFERSFASLGLSYLKEKSPRLFDNFVGFQLVDKNEDSTKAFGIYGFRIGKKWFHVPIVFANDDIRGHEIFCSLEDKIIAPLKENWIDALTSSESTSLGKGSVPNGQRLSSGGIDLRNLAFPQELHGKFANWLQPSLPDYAQIVTKTATVEPFTLDLSAACSRSARTAGAVLHMAQRLPLIKNGLDRFYPGLVDRLPDLSVRLRMPSLDPQIVKTSLFRDEAEVVEAPPLVVLRKAAAGMSDDEKASLKTKRYIIRDNRGDENKSTLLDDAVDFTTFGPESNGLYDVVVSPHKIEKRVVFVHMSGPSLFDQTLLVVDPKSKKFKWCDARDVHCIGKHPRVKFMDWVEALGKAVPDVDQKFVALTAGGWASKPLRVCQKLDGGRFTARYENYDGQQPGEYCGVQSTTKLNQQPPRFSKTEPLRADADGEWILTPTDRDGIKPTFLMQEMLLPKNVRYLKLDSTYARDDGENVLEPRAYEMLLQAVRTKSSSLKVMSHGGDWLVDAYYGRQEVDRGDLVPFLVETYGLDEKRAEDVLEAAEKSGEYKGRIKIADRLLEQSFGNVGNTHATPNTLPYELGGETLAFGRVPSYTTQTDRVQLPVDYQPWKSLEELWQPHDDTDLQRVTQVAQEASQTGIKQVFDVGMFSAIVDFNAIDDESQRAVREFMKTMTSAGKLYLMFCYHPEDVEEKFGKTEAPQIRDALLKLNETAGDVALYLKDKKLRPVLREDDEANVEQLDEDN